MMQAHSTISETLRDNQSTRIDRSQLPEAQSDLIFNLVLELEELAGHVESLAALTWVVSRFDGFDPPLQRAMDGLQEHADTISRRLMAFSDRFGVSFGFNSGAEPSPARGLQDRASAAFA